MKRKNRKKLLKVTGLLVGSYLIGKNISQKKEILKLEGQIDNLNKVNKGLLRNVERTSYINGKMSSELDLYSKLGKK